MISGVPEIDASTVRQQLRTGFFWWRRHSCLQLYGWLVGCTSGGGEVAFSFKGGWTVALLQEAKLPLASRVAARLHFWRRQSCLQLHGWLVDCTSGGGKDDFSFTGGCTVALLEEAKLPSASQVAGRLHFRRRQCMSRVLSPRWFSLNRYTL